MTATNTSRLTRSPPSGSTLAGTPAYNCYSTLQHKTGGRPFSPSGEAGIMGCVLHRLLRVFPPRRTAAHQAVRLQPETPPLLGGHGRRQSAGPNHASISPEAVKNGSLRPGRRHCTRKNGMWLVPSCRSTDLRSCPGEQARPVLRHLSCEEQEFVCEIRKVLLRLGLPDSEYAGHSFRIGAATSAAMVQLLGRRQSAAFLHYIRTPHERLASISSTLAAQTRND